MSSNNYFDRIVTPVEEVEVVLQGDSLPLYRVFAQGTLFFHTTELRFYQYVGDEWVLLDLTPQLGANVAFVDVANTFTEDQTISGNLTVQDVSASTVSGSRVDFVSGSIDALSGSFVSYTSGSVDVLSGSRLDYVSGDIASASVDRLQFDTSASVTPNMGELVWNDTAQTVDVNLNDEVTLQVGQESLVRARNNTGNTIPNGSVVYVTGALGNRPTIGLACANNGAACAEKILGLTTQDINDNADGFVTTQGTVRELNTSVDGDGVTLLAGDALYASVTPGEWVKTPPSSPDRQVLLGYVTRVNPAEGQVFVRVDNGRTLEELHDVETSAPADGDVIVYDSSQSVWVSTSQSELTISSSQVSDFVSASRAAMNKATIDALDVDADTLDSLDSTQFVRSDQSGSISGSLTITDDLTVNGNIVSFLGDWAGKEGPTSFDISHRVFWGRGYGEGSSLDATSNSRGIIVNESGIYYAAYRHRANSGTDAYGAISRNGDRGAFENRTSMIWNHSHTQGANTYYISEFVGQVNAGEMISAGPTSADSTYVVYNSESYAGTLMVWRLK